MPWTRCSVLPAMRSIVLYAAPHSRDPPLALAIGPGSAAQHAASHSASRPRVNALMALRSIRGTIAKPVSRIGHRVPAVYLI